MKKIILWIVLVLIIAILGLIGWRTWYFYSLIKKGQPISAPVWHFNKSSVQPQAVANPNLANLIAIHSPRLGQAQAKLTIVEFADFSCEYSAEEFPAIREFVNKHLDQVNFIYRLYPLNQTDETSELAALAALCANEQGKFWPYHDKLFQNPSKHSLDDLKFYALQIGLRQDIFDQCLDTKKLSAQLNKDLSDGLFLGVAGTPTFFVNGQKVEGAIPLSAWEELLKQ